MPENYQLSLNGKVDSACNILRSFHKLSDFIDGYERIVNQGQGSAFEQEFYRGMLDAIIEKCFEIGEPNSRRRYTQADALAMAKLSVLDEEQFCRMINFMKNCINNKALPVRDRVLMAYGLANSLQRTLSIPKFKPILDARYEDLNNWLTDYVKCSNALAAKVRNPAIARLFFEGLIGYLEALSFYGMENVDNITVRHKLTGNVVDKFKSYPDMDLRYLVSYLEQGIKRLPVNENDLEQLRRVVNISSSLAFASGAIAAAAVTGGIAFIGLLSVPGDILAIYDNLTAILKERNLNQVAKWYTRPELDSLRKGGELPLIAINERKLDRDFIAGFLSRIEQVITIKMACRETLSGDNLESMRNTLINIAQSCVDKDSDIWLFARSTWLLCQLKREDAIRWQIRHKIQLLQNAIVRARDESAGRSRERQEMLCMADSLVFLLNYTWNPTEEQIKYKLSNFTRIFCDHSIDRNVRENALKALLFLCKYENERYGQFAISACRELHVKYADKRNRIIPTEGASIIEEFMNLNETFREPQPYVKSKSIDESLLFAEAERDVQHNLVNEKRITKAFRLANFPNIDTADESEEAQQNPGWIEWGISSLVNRTVAFFGIATGEGYKQDTEALKDPVARDYPH